MREATGDQFGDYQTGLDCLAETHTIGQQESHAAHTDGAQNRHELVRFDLQSSGLHGQQGIGAERLFEQERLMINEPVNQRRCILWSQLVLYRLDLLERTENVKFQAENGVFQTAQPEECFLPEVFGGNDLPTQAARFDLGSGQQFRRAFDYLIPGAIASDGSSYPPLSRIHTLPE